MKKVLLISTVSRLPGVGGSLLLCLAFCGTLVGAELNPVHDIATTDEDSDLLINVLANDAGDGLILQGVKGAGTGFATSDTTENGVPISVQGTQVFYNPSGLLNHLLPGQSITDVFEYLVDSDKTGEEDEAAMSATVTVNVNGLNDRPVISYSSTIFGAANPQISVNDDSQGTPFSYSSTQKVTIQDPDGPNTQSLRVTIQIQTLTGDVAPGHFVEQTQGFVLADPVNSPGLYTLTATPDVITQKLQALVFVPYPNLEAIGRSRIAKFTITAIESSTSVPNRVSVQAETGIKIMAVNHAPEIFLPSTPQFVFTRSSITPFSDVLITENDLKRVNNANVPQQISATILEVSTSDQRGELRNPTGVTNDFAQDPSNSNRYTIASGIPEDIEAVLRGLVFHASEDYIDPPVETVFQITLVDDGGLSGSNSNTRINTRSPQTLSDIRNTRSGQTVNDSATLMLFQEVVITGGANAMVIRIKDLDAGGQVLGADSPHKLANLTNAGFIFQGNGEYRFEGITSKMTEGIRRLALLPGRNLSHLNDSPDGVLPPYPPTVLGSLQFEIELFSGSSSLGVDNRTTVEIYPVNDLPRLAGVEPIASIQDDATALPFQLVLVDDPDNAGQQVMEAEISLETSYSGPTSTPEIGELLGTFALQGDHYVLTGTPAEVQAGLRDLVFEPVANRIPVGRNETITFRLTLDDRHGGVVTNGRATLVVTSVNDAPVLTGGIVGLDIDGPGAGVVTQVSIDDEAGVLLFDEGRLGSTSSILDIDRPEQALELTIQVDDPAKGRFLTRYTRTGSPGGPYQLQPDENGEFIFDELGDGTYVYLGHADDPPSHAELEAALMGLVFVPDFGFPIPPGAPGIPARFTITVRDPNNEADQVRLDYLFTGTDRRAWIVNRSEDYDPSDPTLTEADKEGTLRFAIEQAASNDFVLIDLRDSDDSSIAPTWPVTIRMEQPLAIHKNLSIFGPSADLLTLSGDLTGDGMGDHRLFEIQARVHMEGLTLADGDHPSSGGAVWIGPDGHLTMYACAVINSSAGQWGGAIDCEQGALHLNQCLIQNNRTSDSFGQGGGAVALYTSEASSFYNSTFSGNRQGGSGGFGGGALYIENADISREFSVDVEHCTFRGNLDFSGSGSSIRAEAFNTWVWMLNTIVADATGRNLAVEAGARILSLGGNVSDDATETIFSQGGESYVVQLFHPHPDSAARFSQSGAQAPYDVVSLEEGAENPILEPLGDNGGPTKTHALPEASQLIGYGLVSERAVDQRGRWRDATPEPGAYEYDAFRELVLNEIHYNPDVDDDLAEDSEWEFVELYNTRTSDPLPDLTGYQLRLGDAVWHTFTAFSSGALERGTGLVVGASADVQTQLPSGVGFQEANGGFPLDNRGGRLTLVDPFGRVMTEARYLGRFEPDLPLFEHQALSRNPEFVGVLVPQNRIAFPGGPSTDDSTPGTTIDGTVLTAGNSPPIAVDDATVLFEDETVTLDVLANDLEPDRFDGLRIVGLGDDPENDTLIESVWGALVEVTDDGTIFYDPTTAEILQSIPEGEELVDYFTYTMIDYALETGIDHPRSASGDPTEAMENRERATGIVELLVLGLNDAPVPMADSVATSPALTTPEDTVAVLQVSGTLLQNDDDPDWDDNANTLLIAALHEPIESEAAGGGTELLPEATGRMEITSLLGARVTLEIRFNRNLTNITYDPTVSETLNALSAQQGEAADDVFFYSVVDRHGATASAMVTVRVTAVNDAPTANPDGPESLISGLVDPLSVFRTWEDVPLTLAWAAVLDNDGDPDIHDILDIGSVSVTSSLGASIQLDSVGRTLQFDPTAEGSLLKELARGEYVLDSFTYTVTDQVGGTDSAEVRILVEGVNNEPLAEPDLYTTDEDTPLGYDPGRGLLDNDLEWDHNGTGPDDRLIVVDYDPMSGLEAPVTILPDGSFSYDPTGLPQFDALLDDFLLDDFQYIASDGSLTIANPDLFTIPANSYEHELQVLANDISLGMYGGAIEIVEYTQPNQGGSLVLDAPDGAFRYRPAGGFFGVEAFSYTIRDEFGAEDLAYVLIHVIAERLNGGLVAQSDTFVAALGTTAELPVLANDGWTPGQPVGLSLIAIAPPVTGALGSPPLEGEIEIVADEGLLRFTPSSARVHDEFVSFRYTIAGGGTVRAEASVHIRLVDRTGMLSLQDDRFTVSRYSRQNPLDVLANDDFRPRLPNGFSLARVGADLDAILNPPSGDARAAATGRGGLVTLTADGMRLLYTPPQPAPAGEYVDTFAYQVKDQGGGTGVAYVEVVVTPGGFVARDDSFTVGKNSAGNALDVLLNDLILPAIDSPGLISEVEGPIEPADPTRVGTLVINPDGTGLFYTPPRNLSELTEWYSYRIEDSEGRTASALIEIRIERDGIFAGDDEFSVLRGSPATRLNVLANDRLLLRPGSLTLSGVGAPDQGGAVVIETDPNTQRQWLLYTPPAGFIGEERFNYEISDGIDLASAEVRILVTVGGLVANEDRFLVAQESVDNLLPVLLNDTILPRVGEQLRVTVVGTGLEAPQHGGTVTVHSDGNALVYTPAPGFAGMETFTYEMTDGSLRRAEGLVRIAVEAREDVLDPWGRDDVYSVRRSSAQNNLPVLLNDGSLAPSGKAFSLLAVSDPLKGGSAAINGQAILYTPVAGFVGTETFTYQFGDGQGGTGTAQVTMVVGSGLANDDRFSVVHSLEPGSEPFVLDVLANDDTDPVSRAQLRIRHAEAQWGTVVIDPSMQALQYTPPVGFTGVDALVYWLEDPSAEAPGDFSAQVAVAVYEPDSDLTIGTVTVRVDGVNDIPRVVGLPQSETLTVYHLLSLQPFASIDIFDPDGYGAQQLTVIITQTDPSRGFLAQLGGFTDLGNGVYSFSGTSAEVTAALQALTFVPTTDGRVTVGGSENTDFTISIDDGVADAVVIEGITVEALHAQVTKLDSVDGPNNDNFGQPVATSEDVIAIGVPYGTSAFGVRTGTVYVYEKVGDARYQQWALAAVLSPPDGQHGNQFGYALDFDGASGILAVGAPYHWANGQASGSVYLFGRDQGGLGEWGMVSRLDPVSGSAGDLFGSAVSVDDTTVAIGARLDRTQSSGGGAVYVFEGDPDASAPWEQATKLVAFDGRSGDQFGYSVALSGDHLAVGCPFDDDKGSASGSVYLFARNENGPDAWGLMQKILADDTRMGDQFGYSVGIDGGLLVVGARYDTVFGNASGSAYAFDLSIVPATADAQWVEVHKFVAESGMRNDEFGHSVAVSGDVVVIGARYDDTRAVNAGAAYVYKRDHDPADRGNPAPDTWGLVEKLVSVDGGITDHFGYSVDIRDDTIVVGSNFDGFGKQVDRTYVFRIKFNNPPIPSVVLPDQEVIRGVPFAFTVALESFADPDTDDTELHYSATSADGGPLPGWLNFDPVERRFSGTAGNFDIGEFQIRVIATDSDGGSAYSDFLIEVVLDPPLEETQGAGVNGPQQAWSLSFFDKGMLDRITDEPVMWGALADPDGDGRSNLYEYAFGTNPQLAAGEDVLNLELTSSGGLMLTYPARMNDARLEFTLQVSTDGTQWSSGTDWVIKQETVPLDGEHELVRLRLAIPDATSDRAFFRIQVRY